MGISTRLNRFRGWMKSSPKAPKAGKPKSRLGVESLEDRLALSTVSLNTATHVLTYQAAPGEVNSLQISLDPATNQFVFSETGGVAIQQGNTLDTTARVAAGLVSRIQVNLGDQSDTATVLSTSKPIAIAGEAGNDTVFIGLSTGRGMEDVKAPISVDGGAQDDGGKDQLILADGDAPATRIGFLPTRLAYSVDGAAITRLPAAVLGTPLPGPLQFNTTTVTRQRLGGFGRFVQTLSSVQVSSTNMERLDVVASNQSDTITVNSTVAPTAVDVDAGDGDDAILVGNMDRMAGKLTVRGEGGADSLTINDTAAATGRAYVINTDSVQQGTTTVGMDVENLTINAPNQFNSFTVQSTDTFTTLNLHGGTLGDTVVLDDTGFTAGQTYSFNAGNLTRTTDFGAFQLATARINYSSVDVLVVNAGSGNDRFKMSETAQPPLRINGGAGASDEIDYSAFLSPVTVNMALGNATKVISMTGVENADGGKGNDILVGDANDNVLRGNAGRDLIIGGKGADQIFGGADQDLMIASDTAFDTNASALALIRNVWAGLGGIQDRINELKIGVGGNHSIKLNETTVHVSGTLDDAARDHLDSGDNLIGTPANPNPNTPDWFWANLGSLATQDDLTLLTDDRLN
jgi:hypothetical protein